MGLAGTRVSFHIVTESVLLARDYNYIGGSVSAISILHGTLATAMNNPSGSELANVLGVLENPGHGVARVCQSATLLHKVP